MERLRREYGEGLGQDLAVLAAARPGLSDPSVSTRVRELAHRLRGSGAAYGFPALSAAAAMTEDAPARELAARLDDLIFAIERARADVGL